MKKFFTVSILSFCFFISYAQKSKTPVFSKITATWCSNCGSWGWDFMEEMKLKYNDSSEAVLLGVHYSGNLKNPTAEWFSNNLKPQGQPVFFVNNEDQNASRNNWQSKVPLINDKIDAIQTEEPMQNFTFRNAYINDANEIVANITFEAHNNVDDDYYFGVYIFENNVQEAQTPRGTSSHPNVLRDVISDNPNGDFLFGMGDISIAGNYTKEYSKAMNNTWDANNIGLLAILWKKNGDTYEMDNSSVIYNIGLLSSSIELIDEDIVDVKTLSDHIALSVEDNEEIHVNLINAMGQVVSQKTFLRNTEINTLNLTAGIYTLHLSQGNRMLSKQVFINN